jgi:exodeoxyribonuclease-3
VLEGLQGSKVQQDVFVEWVSNLDPDIAVLQELNGFTEEDLSVLARRYGHEHAVRLHEKGYRVGLTSKYPLQNVQRVTKGMRLGYIYAEVDDWHLFALHLDPFKEEERLKELEIILAHAGALPTNSKIMCIGDFNSLAASDKDAYAHPDFEKNYQYRGPDLKVEFDVTNKMLEAGYTDAYSLFHSEFKATFPTAKRIAPEAFVRVDYAFLNAPLKDECVDAQIIYDRITRFLSDHYPLVVRFTTD